MFNSTCAKLMVCAILAVALTNSLLAQSPRTAPPGALLLGAAEEPTELDKIKAEIDAIKLKFATREELGDVVGRLTNVDQSLTNEIEQLRNVASQNTGDLLKLQQKVEEEIRNRIGELQRVTDRLEAISTKTPGGQYVPVLGQLQRDERFGRVVVRNQMPTPQFVTVNDEGRWVDGMGGEADFQRVAPGMVRTTIPGYEGPKGWHLGPATGYELLIEIVARQ